MTDAFALLCIRRNVKNCPTKSYAAAENDEITSDAALLGDGFEKLHPSGKSPTTKVSSTHHISSRPTPALMMKALNTSPRRIFLSTLASSAIAVTSNFCGITSNILAQFPEETVEKTGADLFYPRGDMKRFRSGEYQYTFVVPKEWVQDTAVELAKIQSRAGRLDYSMKKK